MVKSTVIVWGMEGEYFPKLSGLSESEIEWLRPEGTESLGTRLNATIRAARGKDLIFVDRLQGSEWWLENAGPFLAANPGSIGIAPPAAGFGRDLLTSHRRRLGENDPTCAFFFCLSGRACVRRNSFSSRPAFDPSLSGPALWMDFAYRHLDRGAVSAISRRGSATHVRFLEGEDFGGRLSALLGLPDSEAFLSRWKSLELQLSAPLLKGLAQACEARDLPKALDLLARIEAILRCTRSPVPARNSLSFLMETVQ
jgi:hypothetical protein